MVSTRTNLLARNAPSWHPSVLRGAADCLDCVIGADLIDPGRVDLFERWESQAALETARGNAPGFEQAEAMLSVSVADYDVADVRPLFGGARHEPPHGSCHDRSDRCVRPDLTTTPREKGKEP